MICRECGAEVEAESIFCHKCGERLEDLTGGGTRDEPVEPQGASREQPDADRSADDPRDRLTEARPGAREDVEESDLWEGGYSPKAMIGAWIGAGVATVIALIAAIMYGYWQWIILGLCVMWLILGLRLAYKRLSVRYRLTNQRFFHELGILSRTTDRIEVIDMDDINFTQGLIERIVNVGAIKITSSDRTHPELTLEGIDNVNEVARLLDDARRKERMRRGLYIESI
jgi:uncharacterized membrane protein YdbT with pleckstrin-like domain